MLQLGARWYWPELGRFIQQDPIGDDINRYAYAANNPLVSIDPEGLVLNRLADKISEGLMQIFWDPVSGPTSGARSDPWLASLLDDVRGGLPCWSARDATKNVLVKPFVVTGMYAAGRALPRGGGAGRGTRATVSRWGRPGLQPGDWVMKGKPNWPNYILSGKWQPGFTNQFAPFTSGRAYNVAASALKWPAGFWGPFKGLVGQRMYIP